MPVIKVPRPSKNAMDPSRPVNALLLAQVSNLQHAERRLPLHYRSDIYTHAIKTEGEAAEYIRHVTEAIQRAHADAEKRRARPERREQGLEIAAAAARPARKRSSPTKKKTGRSKRKKK